MWENSAGGSRELTTGTAGLDLEDDDEVRMESLGLLLGPPLVAIDKVSEEPGSFDSRVAMTPGEPVAAGRRRSSATRTIPSRVGSLSLSI